MLRMEQQLHKLNNLIAPKISSAGGKVHCKKRKEERKDTNLM